MPRSSLPRVSSSATPIVMAVGAVEVAERAQRSVRVALRPDCEQRRCDRRFELELACQRGRGRSIELGVARQQDFERDGAARDLG